MTTATYRASVADPAPLALGRQALTVLGRDDTLLQDDCLAQSVRRFSTAYPHWRRRAERAAYLIAAGHLYHPPPGMPTAIALVRSQSHPEYSYFLHYTPTDRLTCTCPDFTEAQNVAAPQANLCKHLIAFILLAHLNCPLVALPTPVDVWTQVRQQVQTIITPMAWHKLFADLALDPASTATQLVLCHPSPIAAEWLQLPRWHDPLTRLMRRTAGYDITLLITTRKD